MVNQNQVEVNQFKINRYPSSSNRSLKAWNAADELLLDIAQSNQMDKKQVAICHDRFGFLTLNLPFKSAACVLEFKSQEMAINNNLSLNNVERFIAFKTPLDQLETLDAAFIKVPKSLDLFRLYLDQVSKSIKKTGVVYCGFMTRNFTPKLIAIAEEYFTEVTQSRAVKKARLILLKGVKQVDTKLVNQVPLNSTVSLSQYLGVFSADHIDYATQFMLENIDLGDGGVLLDLASGNGVVALELSKKKAWEKIHLVDDSFLAIASSKLNCKGDVFVFHQGDSLATIEDASIDLVVSNPPFHFEYETNIEVSIELFKQVKRCLKPGGSFQLVSNQHLNYKTHLSNIFGKVLVINENEKFVVYKCF